MDFIETIQNGPMQGLIFNRVLSLLRWWGLSTVIFLKTGALVLTFAQSYVKIASAGLGKSMEKLFQVNQP